MRRLPLISGAIGVAALGVEFACSPWREGIRAWRAMRSLGEGLMDAMVPEDDYIDSVWGEYEGALDTPAPSQ